MRYTQLGACGPRVSVLALGTWQFGDGTHTFRTQQTRESRAQIVRAALDAGINFFDTAEAYLDGEAECCLGQALRDCGVKRADIVVASKLLPTATMTPQYIRERVDRTLQNLGMDYLDLYQIHWPVRDTPLAEVLPVFRELQQSGKVRHFGLSNYGVLDTAEAVGLAGDLLVSNQLPYSLLCRAIEYGIVEACQAAHLSVLAYSPLAQGLLAGRYPSLEAAIANDGLSRSRLFHHSRSQKCRHKEEGCEDAMMAVVAAVRQEAKSSALSMGQLAVAWVLANQNIAVAVVGASSPEQIQHIAAAADVTLPTATLERLAIVSEPVKTHIGPSPDLWDGNSRYR